MSTENYDDFDIDIYGADDAPGEGEGGDASNGDVTQGHGVEAMNIEGQDNQKPDQQPQAKQESVEANIVTSIEPSAAEGKNGPDASTINESKDAAPEQSTNNGARPAQSTPKPQMSTEDTRPIDPGASSALIVSDLQWWTSDNEITGWAVDCGCEEELKDITFCEHKQNGKSKG